MLDEEQEGFHSHKSTVRSLYRLKMECQEVRMSRKSGALISIDFEKAFDSVWINGLLQKLYQSGVRGKFIKLIKCILKNRQLSLEIGNWEANTLEPKMDFHKVVCSKTSTVISSNSLMKETS